VNRGGVTGNDEELCSLIYELFCDDRAAGYDILRRFIAIGAPSTISNVVDRGVGKEVLNF